MRRILTILVLLCPLLVLGQAKTRELTGQILDRTDGTPLVGATVFIAPSETQARDYNPQGTISGTDGRFTFTLPESVRFVMVSFIGYESLKVEITGQKTITVRLAPEETNIDAVVVTGYQKIEKRKLTSSISTVDMSQVKQIGVASVDQLLEGQLAGVFSAPTTGAPGAGSAVKIRSTVTLNGTTAPLWVLDGMPLEGNEIPSDWSAKENIDNLYNMSIAGLNPDDIKDITVLKDAAATAIYGARAANGVIIITTKKGEKGQRLRVNASAAVFVSTKPNLDKLELMNASEKVDFELQLAANGRLNYRKAYGGVSRILDATKGEREALVSGGFGALKPETQAAINALRADGANWADEIYRPAVNQQYSLNVSGGGEKATYYFSTGYYNEQGTTRGTGFERFNLTMKTDYDLLKNLRFGASLFYGQNRNNSYVTDADAFINPARYTRKVNPYLNIYNADGTYLYDPDMTLSQGDTDDRLNFNYLEEMANTAYEMKVKSFKSVFDLEYKPLEGLKLYTQLGLQIEDSGTEKSADKNSYYVRKYAQNSVIDHVVYLPEGGVIQNWDTDLNQYNWKLQAEYSKTFARKHEMDLMAGLEMRGTKNTAVHTKGFGYDSRTLVTTPIVFPDTDAGKDKAENALFRPYQKTFYENRYLSYFVTGSYTYDNRYTFFGSMRYDGTNLFGVDPKYKFNPMWSVSGAWNMHRESFMRGVKWIDNLRLRASYGAQGNIDRTTSPYIIGTWNTGSILGTTEDRINVTAPPNQYLRWETTYSWNAALDLGVLGNRLNMTFEVYGRRSKDLITTRAIPHETGFTTTSSNFGEISSRGVEFSLNSVNVTNKNFRWETQLNLAHNTDKVEKVFYDNQSWTPSLQGHSSSAIFGFKTAGLDENGIPMFWKNGQKVSLQEFVGFKVDATADVFGDVSYNPSMNNTQADVISALSYLGDRNPKITGGFNNKFYYKNFDLSVSCNFVIKQMVTETPFYDPTQTSPGENYPRKVNQIWSASNPSGIYPALTGSLMADGSSWSSWENYDDYRAMYYILDNYPIAFFSNLDIWNREISYLRVNSIRLGYTLPESAAKKLHLASVRFSFEARNPLVIASNYSGYFDPETYGNIYAQPIPRIYSFGINISF